MAPRQTAAIASILRRNSNQRASIVEIATVEKRACLTIRIDEALVSSLKTETLELHEIECHDSKPPPTLMYTDSLILRWSLTGAPLPPVFLTLSIGEVARRATLACLGGPERQELPGRLAGHSLVTPLSHRHPFFLPMDADGDGLIDHLVIHFPEGLEQNRVSDLNDRLRRLWLPDGQAWNLVPTEPAILLDVGTTWDSVTPYVLTRFPKLRHNGSPKLNDRGEQRDGPADQVRREWEQLRLSTPSLPVLERVALVPNLSLRDGSSVGWREFDCHRQNGHMTTSRMAYGVRLEFNAPLTGPLALGAGQHFGLGQFRAKNTLL